MKTLSISRSFLKMLAFETLKKYFLITVDMAIGFTRIILCEGLLENIVACTLNILLELSYTRNVNYLHLCKPK
jgi:hypothetical protein